MLTPPASAVGRRRSAACLDEIARRPSPIRMRRDHCGLQHTEQIGRLRPFGRALAGELAQRPGRVTSLARAMVGRPSARSITARRARSSACAALTASP